MKEITAKDCRDAAAGLKAEMPEADISFTLTCPSATIWRLTKVDAIRDAADLLDAIAAEREHERYAGLRVAEMESASVIVDKGTALLMGAPQSPDHHCDNMGCSSAGPHVLARLPFDWLRSNIETAAEHCARTHIQCCHACNNFDCGDNTRLAAERDQAAAVDELAMIEARVKAGLWCEFDMNDVRRLLATVEADKARIAELDAQLEQHHRVVDAAEQHCKRADELGDEVDRLTAQLARAREMYAKVVQSPYDDVDMERYDDYVKAGIKVVLQ